MQTHRRTHVELKPAVLRSVQAGCSVAVLMRQFPKEVQVSIGPDNNTGRRRGAFRTAHEEWHGAGGPGLQAAIEGVDAV